MIKELTIQNFRSIREATLELGRFTVLNGANNSGKSSVLYALQVLKNIMTNPNQTLDDLLNLQFLNLGGIEETLFGKKTTNGDLRIEIMVSEPQMRNLISTFAWINSGFFRENILEIKGISPIQFAGSIVISFPYTLNKFQKIKVENFNTTEFTWNGFEVKDFVVKDSDVRDFPVGIEVMELVHAIRSSEVVPTHRGFTKPIFNQIPLNGTIQTEEEVATHLAIDKNLQAKVSHYFEKITGKRFSVSMSPGVGFFYLQVREPDTPFTTELVNQGMGVNQILFLLAKILYDKNRLICIDEPEIHLHPALIERFMQVLVEIAEKEDKQFLFSTHSEHLLMSLLAEVYEGKLAADDLKVYFLQKEGAETTIEAQEVQANGQIKGGLKNFLETQMRLAQRFFPAETAV